MPVHPRGGGHPRPRSALPAQNGLRDALSLQVPPLLPVRRNLTPPVLGLVAHTTQGLVHPHTGMLCSPSSGHRNSTDNERWTGALL